SENGVNWVKEVSPTEENLRGITFGKRMMHIVGGKRLSLLVSNGILLSSTNGAEWEVRLTNKMLRSVAFDGNSFLAAGYEGALFSSYDGNLWREATTPV